MFISCEVYVTCRIISLTNLDLGLSIYRSLFNIYTPSMRDSAGVPPFYVPLLTK